VTIVVDKKFIADPLCLDQVSSRTERSKTDDLTDHTVSGDFNRGDTTLSLLSEGAVRYRLRGEHNAGGGSRATQKCPTIHTTISLLVARFRMFFLSEHNFGQARKLKA
jgi:hypothetical protein